MISQKVYKKVIKTKNDLNKKVDPSEFKISNVVIKKNGVAVVKSVNENESDKIKEVMEKNLDNEYDIKYGELLNQKLQLLEKLKRQNECISNDKIKVIKQYEVKKTNGSSYNTIIETEVETFNKIIFMKK